MFVLASLLPVTALGAPGFAQRLEALQRALAEHAASFVPDPARHARVLWLHIDADAQPDAIVVVKKEASDCAVHFASATAQCMGFILRALDDRRYAPMAMFPYAGQVVYLGRRGAQGRDLFHADRNEARPVYDRYRLADGRFQLHTQGVPAEELLDQAYVGFSDRSMDRLVDQQYAIRTFPENMRAALSPARVHLDAVNARYFTEDLVDRTTAERMFTAAAVRLERAVRRDAAELAARLGWPNQMNVRMWVCTDWMVPRRFWEYEDDRPADIGTCIDPVFYWEQLLKLDEPGSVLAMRVRLLQDIGVAFLLRGEYLSVRQVRTLKQRSNDDQAVAAHIVSLGSALGAWFALESAQIEWAALDLAFLRWDVLLETWEDWERRQGYVLRTPELDGFVRDMGWRRLGSDCLREIVTPATRYRAGEPAATPCPAALRQDISRLLQFVEASTIR